jgi:hypothetical protein
MVFKVILHKITKPGSAPAPDKILRLYGSTHCPDKDLRLHGCTTLSAQNLATPWLHNTLRTKFGDSMAPQHSPDKIWQLHGSTTLYKRKFTAGRSMQCNEGKRGGGQDGEVFITWVGYQLPVCQIQYGTTHVISIQYRHFLCSK